MTIIFLALFLVLATWLFMQHPKFGKAPEGARLERMEQSPNFREGSFQNLSETPQLAEDASMAGVMFKFLFEKKDGVKPADTLKFSKTDLKTLDKADEVYIWMGHSSYFIQTGGKRFLVDPVLSGAASPLSFTTRAFPGSDVYKAEDIPEIDYLVISHDHWDHLDYETVTALRSRIKHVIAPLGVGAHLEHWDFNPDTITELDWYESVSFDNFVTFNAEPARHFSGRGFKRNGTLWASYLLEIGGQKIYIGGDSGYDDHFKVIGKKYGSIDLAILETGQYNSAWKYIHMIPGEQIQALKDLNAKRYIPVHNSKFALAMHTWKEPIEAVVKANDGSIRIITPEIGEKVFWENDSIQYDAWWKEFN
ncbi:MBL fold metallo-hydrolase [Robertkochia solimangrovi]|uniref:MBL fold metallo-hydrolase n=1 Tax=Robertkochia solimangrovi TaxID=2213046 RepID=UPI00118075CA|nr:MBL fold metallo-hydrolase [Robertkochia solimangrovi]TRZ43798.1 MBL fold metallo-hydrolase [Robertkochia solimangrovi]